LRNLVGDETVTVVTTSPHGHEATVRRLRRHIDELGARSVLCIAAGDGTVASAIETLLLDPAFAAVRDTPILPLWGGNANDLARMLNGSTYRARLGRLLRQGKVLAVHPLACRLEYPDGHVVTRIAACYASFGATAFAAHRLNQPGHRDNWLHRLPGGRPLRQFLTVVSAFAEAPPFTLQDGKSARIVYERTFANGSRFAGINRLPVRLAEDTVYFHTLDSGQPLLRSLSHLFRSLRRKLSDALLHDQADFIVQEQIWGQFDGEAVRIDAGTKVHVQLSEMVFRAVSTKG
jgi:hypothetical protein